MTDPGRIDAQQGNDGEQSPGDQLAEKLARAERAEPGGVVWIDEHGRAEQPVVVSPDERYELIEQIVEHAKQVEASLIPRPPVPFRLPFWVQAMALVIFGGLIVAPPAMLLPAPSRPQSVDISQGTRLNMWLVANDIERFRRTNGRLPTSLDEINRAGRGIVYTPIEPGVYELRTVIPALSWRSTDSLSLIADRAPRTLVPARPQGLFR